MTAWVHRSFDIVLLRFAQRDFRDTINVKRQALTAANQWTTDIQVKSEYIAEKIAQIIAAFAAQQKVNNVQHPALDAQASNQTGNENAATEREMEAREHAYKALKAQMMEKQQQKEKSATSAGGYGNAEKKKKPLFVDLSQMSSKPSTPAANASKTQDAVQSATGAMPTAKPSVPEKKTGAIPTAQVPTSTKPTSTPAVPRAPLSPRVVQQLYEIDLSSRNCSITADESEDKFYIPMKSISKVMRRALPGGSNETTATMTTKIPTHVGIKDSVQNVAVATPATELSAETNDDHVGDAKSGPEKQEPLPASAGGEIQEAGNGKQQAPVKTSTREADDNVNAAGDEEKAASSATPAAPNPLPSSLSDESHPTTRSETTPKTATTAKQYAAQVPGIKIDDDAVAFMQECVTEFILFLTSEAKDHCTLDKKKSTPLLGSHVVQGMSNLGFSTYAKVLDTYNSKLKKMQDAMNQKKLIEKKHRQQHKQLEALAAAKAAAASALQNNSSSGNAASNTTESKVAVGGVALGIAFQAKQNPAAVPEAANGALSATKAAATNLPSEHQGTSQAGVNTITQ
uniref:Transcription factor CBF/NF-Y/archaeal histone domain-containing protein n=1 Tax=Globisporangium ultimum (strain ATCC 200006 / CBS 805.95 / DAOM BR144) TaxID=431595 RepID=K3WTC2_GLOUD